MTVPEIAIRTPLGSDLLGFMVDMSANYDATSHGQNSFTLTETATGRSLTLHGLGFTFHNGALTGGTVLSINFEDSGGHYAVIDSISLDAVTVVNTLTGAHPEDLFDLMGSSLANGNDGADALQTGDGNDTLNGHGGDDILIGGDGADALFGGGGNDTASYANAAVGVVANLSNVAANRHDAAGDSYDSISNLTGSAHDDRLVGDAHANVFTGGDGNDTLNGGAGADTLYGGNGVDAITGGAGQDVMYGGAGADTFRWTSSGQAAAALGSSDAIGDWGGTDLIAVSAAGFGGGLVAGQALTASQFHVDSAPIGANGQFLYNTFADALLWDDDGTGSDPSVVVVHFLTNETLSSSDIVVF